MPIIPCDLRTAYWSGPCAGSFRPKGEIRHVAVSALASPTLGAEAWRSTDTLSARLFVGFSVGGDPKYDLDDLIPIVREVRTKQAPDDPSATFLLQRGIYKYRRTGEIVEEDGAQVVIIDTLGTDPETFEKQMIELAEEIARRLEQELVVVEIQRRGVVQVTIGVEP